MARHCAKKLVERRTAYCSKPFAGTLRVTNPVR
jgi:hypothetical protein